jgi:hypothetical protein
VGNRLEQNEICLLFLFITVWMIYHFVLFCFNASKMLRVADSSNSLFHYAGQL